MRIVIINIIKYMINTILNVVFNAKYFNIIL